MDRLLAEMDEGGVDPDTVRQQDNLERLFGRIGDEEASTDAIDKMLSKNNLSVAASKANYLKWQAAGKNFKDRLEVDGDGTASANMRYTETVVQSTMEKLMHHVESTENVGHVFAENQMANCGMAVSILISQSKNKINWSTGDRCWQDVFIREMVRLVGNSEEMVHGFLEGLSVDQLEPYMEAIQTVNADKTLRLLIHAPPGSGKT